MEYEDGTRSRPSAAAVAGFSSQQTSFRSSFPLTHRAVV